MIWYMLTVLAALVVSIIPALIVGYGASRTVRGFGTQENTRTILLFAVVFAMVYVASAWALIAWWV